LGYQSVARGFEGFESEMKNKLKRRKPVVIKPRKTIDPKRLINVSHEGVGLPGAPDAAYVDRENGVCVQIWLNETPGCKGTPWQGTLRVAVKHTRATSVAQIHQRGLAKPIEWDDMQAIKDHFWPERIAVEVYPPRDKIVDVADMRWMWVLPIGAMLPFNLQATSVDRLVS